MVDYIVVGSGPAGCVLANRLSENPAVSVLLLEAGGSDRSPIIRMPAAVPFAYMSKRLGWGFESGPEPHLGGRTIDEKRGRVLGGSSSINAMIFNRGNPLDYDGWAGFGLPRWNWANCLPYFKKMETFAGGADAWRGTDGPLRVSRCKAEFPLYEQFLRAGEQAGFPVTPDHNGEHQEGFHIAQAYIHGGERSSASTSYLDPVRHRANLHIRTHARVTRVLFSGTRAIGVAVASSGKEDRIECNREVILAAGAFGSPQLLMLSGIGDPEELGEHDIPVRVALPAIGKHLENHPGVNVQFETEARHSIVSRLGPIARARLGAEWLLFRRGLGTTNFFEAGAFLRTRPDVPYPNVQFELMPLVRHIEGGKIKARPGFNFWLDLSRPASRGRVRLRSADPNASPSIVFNHLNMASDLQDLVDGVALARRIAHQGALSSIVKAELLPGPGVTSRIELAAWVAANVGTSYHPSGTCRMGTGDDSVVSDEGCVHGTSALRVVDASIMPSTVTGNISAAVYMIAEKVADAMRAQAGPLTTPPPLQEIPNL